MKMNKSKWFLTGMAALLLLFGLILAGCPTDSDDGGGGGDYTGEGATPTGFKFRNVGGDQISTYTDVSLDAIASNDSTKEGFTVTVNGEPQTISVFVGGRKLNINLKNYQFSVTDTVLISYDGTGYFAGKLKKFTDIPVTLDDPQPR
ncbi:MAG: hypothetical protein LBH70_08480 [Spirochaetaceae bacterium]|nr:hypothetical protein [Spirochaetaceae bacterium]